MEIGLSQEEYPLHEGYLLTTERVYNKIENEFDHDISFNLYTDDEIGKPLTHKELRNLILDSDFGKIWYFHPAQTTT